jgi:hypothetical protein
MNTNEVYNQIPCCSCGDWRRDRVLTRLGAFYLRSLSGQAPKPPTLDELTRGCCQRPEAANEGVTFIMPGQVDPPTPWEKRGPRW